MMIEKYMEKYRIIGDENYRLTLWLEEDGLHNIEIDKIKLENIENDNCIKLTMSGYNILSSALSTIIRGKIENRMNEVDKYERE